MGQDFLEDKCNSGNIKFQQERCTERSKQRVYYRESEGKAVGVDTESPSIIIMGMSVTPVPRFMELFGPGQKVKNPSKREKSLINLMTIDGATQFILVSLRHTEVNEFSEPGFC